MALPGDIRSESFCQSLVADAVEQLGGLSIPVNNAGRQQYCETLEELTTEDFDATFKTNVYAPFWITRAALPHLRPEARLSIPPRCRRINPARSCSIMRRPKPVSRSSLNRWLNRWRNEAFA